MYIIYLCILYTYSLHDKYLCKILTISVMHPIFIAVQPCIMSEISIRLFTFCRSLIWFLRSFALNCKTKRDLLVAELFQWRIQRS